ncbi:ROK family transcriptional regulator [Bowmanella denitrificans]|uniref:ROK family transcriptional regulator n=1 Tax=Bowmanella denitrificans TaxID=366582 RepID=UPI0011AFD1BA|nr:ROK family transcriptional regulator [Bowmanella denitrificans]
MQASNSKQNKALNLRLVLSHIATLSPISRAEIAKITGLTKQTITNMVDELLAADLVAELGIKKEGTVGKPSKMLALSGKGTYSLGIRVFAQHCQLAMYNLTNEKLGQCQIERGASLEHGLELAMQALLADYAVEPGDLLGIGLSFVDQFDHQYPNHQARQDFTQLLADKLNQPVVLETTAAACAACHMLHGEARGLNSFVYIHLGLQVESAVVFGRQIMLGHNQLTGAMGEIFVTPETSDKDGELGRLNDFASLDALRGQARQPHMDLVGMAALLDSQPQVVDKWLEQAAEPMRIAIHMLESVLNTQTIIFGGDITPELLDLLIARLRPLIPSISQYGERDVPRILKTPNVQDIALSGVATLPLHSALDMHQPYAARLPQLAELTTKQALLFVAN